jgi:hypothetical protein
MLVKSDATELMMLPTAHPSTGANATRTDDTRRTVDALLELDGWYGRWRRNGSGGSERGEGEDSEEARHNVCVGW